MKIDNVDIAGFIAQGGFRVSKAELTSGVKTAISGKTIRHRIATKTTVSVDCRPLRKAELKTVLDAISGEWLSVTFFDPEQNSESVLEMYCESRPYNLMIRRRNGEEWWDGISFTLKER